MEIGTRAWNSLKAHARLIKVSYVQTLFTVINVPNGNNIVNNNNSAICNEKNNNNINNKNNNDINNNSNNSGACLRRAPDREFGVNSRLPGKL